MGGSGCHHWGAAVLNKKEKEHLDIGPVGIDTLELQSSLLSWCRAAVVNKNKYTNKKQTCWVDLDTLDWQSWACWWPSVVATVITGVG